MMDVSEAGAEGSDGRWPPRLAQAQLAASSRRYSESLSSSPHIFSHKGGLVQEGGGGGAAQYSPYEPGAGADPALATAAWRARAWPPPPPRPHHVQPPQPIQTFQIDSSGGDERGWGPEGAEAAGGMVEVDPRRAWPVPIPSRLDQELSMYLPAKTMPEVPVVYNTGAQATLRDGPKKGFPLAPRPALAPAPPVPSVTTASPTPVERNHTPEKTTKEKSSPPSEAHRESGGEAAGAGRGAPREQYDHYSQPDEHDGLSEHPPAAVLLLVLGLCMTGVVGCGAACRARAARRRMRRGKPPFAHDADYLVNGMYL